MGRLTSAVPPSQQQLQGKANRTQGSQSFRPQGSQSFPSRPENPAGVAAVAAVDTPVVIFFCSDAADATGETTMGKGKAKEAAAAPYAYVAECDGCSAFAVCGVMPTKRALFNVYILVLRAAQGVRLAYVLLNRADDGRQLQEKTDTKVQDITLAQAYWLFVKPGLELTDDMPSDDEVPIVLDFFRRAAPPNRPPDLSGLCWQPRLALAGALPLGCVRQSVRIQGLVAKPHFNNLTGLVEGVLDTGRIIVSLHLPYNGTEALTLKPETVKPWRCSTGRRWRRRQCNLRLTCSRRTAQ